MYHKQAAHCPKPQWKQCRCLISTNFAYKKDRSALDLIPRTPVFQSRAISVKQNGRIGFLLAVV